MELAARKINQPTVVNPTETYRRVWTFRTQALMDLWINEMQGQISDGMWENSRNTEWLWKGSDLYKLGDKTELLYVSYGWETRRTSFGLTKELIDCIEERIYTENGFEFGNVRELREAWKEITSAIKSARMPTAEEYNMYKTIPENNRKREVEDAKNVTYKYLDDKLRLTDWTKQYGCYWGKNDSAHIKLEVKDSGKISFETFDCTHMKVTFSKEKLDDVIEIYRKLKETITN